MPADIRNPDLLDSLGYGLALPSKYIMMMLDGIRTTKNFAVEQQML
jgi:hypothetical protein